MDVKLGITATRESIIAKRICYINSIWEGHSNGADKSL